MKKLLYLLCIFFCLFSCGEDKDIPTENPPIDNPDPNENTVTNDSLFYQLNVEGYELIAATQSGTSLFLQADTTFAFRCLYDSCKTDHLVAYCDSTGMVERIIVEDRVFDMLYHEDYKKMDILFSNEGKIEWIKNVENPYFDQFSRSTEENVPYSAISVVSKLSYAVYKIIDTYPLYMKKSLSRLVKLYGMPPVETETTIQWIVKILGEKFDETIIKQQYATIATVMKDYSKWVMDELYGDAIPLTYTWVERMKNDSIRFRAYVNDVDSLKTDFRMGMYIESGAYTHRPFHKHNYKEDMESGFKKHKKCALMATYNGSMQYGFVSDILPSGKKYKFRSFLVPFASSKYLNDMKCLIDYTRYGEIDYFHLFEAKANVISTEEDKATLVLSTELDDYHKNFKLGVYYGTNPDLPENDRMKMEVDVQSLTSASNGQISREITLTELEPETTYYFMPFIQYDGNIVNRSLQNVTNVTIFDKDKIFMGKAGSFTTEKEEEEENEGNSNGIDEWLNSGNNYASIRRVLDKLYKDTDGDNWYRNDNWLSDKPLYDWYGVNFVRSGSGFALSIKLGHNNLKGNINFSGVKDFHFGGNFNYNNISTINASNSNLIALYIDESNLKSLNLAECHLLTDLYCRDNQLESFDIKGCLSLKELYCENNKLESLKVESELLEELFCDNNQLKLLEVNSNILEHIQCRNNQLKSLKIDSKKLKQLDCSNNQLTSLDIKGNQSLRVLYCKNNKIKREITRRLLENWFDPVCITNKFLGVFSYDFRYDYVGYEDENGNLIEYIDKGVGWWCTGEPDSHEVGITQLF